MWPKHLENFRSDYQNMIACGLRKFLLEYFDPSKCTEPRRNVVDILVSIQLRYLWAKLSFDGGLAYKKTDDLIKRLARIAKLADQLAIECENSEVLYLVGDVALNLEKLDNLRDSQGVEHQSIDTFVGGLMTRVCLDSTVLADGLYGVRERNSRSTGRPPIVSNNYLILTGMDLYESVLGLGPIRFASPKNPTKPDDYEGDFFDFIDCYTALLAKEAFEVSKKSTGFGSMVGKVLSRYREDKNLPKGLNPTSENEELLLSINTLASLIS